jgi:hypothetical protein
MKNIHLIPTDKPSRLHLGKSGLVLCDLVFNPTTINSQNIYITNSEKPKQGEWSLYQNKIHKCIEDILGDEFKKIILTTDQDLIKDGVQAIDDEFLQWFVTNQSCEDVEVKRNYLGSKCLKCGFIENHDEVDTENCPKCSNTRYEHLYLYKIIIPQEEPKNTCPKCRTTDFETCHSIKCPMRKEEPKQIYYNTVGRENGVNVVKGQFNTQKEALDLADELNRKFPYLYYDWRETLIKEEPKQEEYICPHPERRKDYYRDGCFKCWECGKIVVEHNNFIEQGTIEEAAERLWLDPTSQLTSKNSFIQGAKSDAARDYWYKKFWEDYNSQFKNQKDGDH